MDRGATVENPYASVTIPRAQLKDSFLHYYLGGDLSPDTVLVNPGALPTYSAAAQEKEREAAQATPYAAAWDGPKIQTQETWARPFNPYASLKMPNGGSPEESFHWKSHPVATAGTSAGQEGCCCCACARRCCPCCKRCCCVVS